MDARLRVLSVDGGGIRGLIPALVIAEIERRLSHATGSPKRIADYFHMLAGTSTGGLIALGLTAPSEADPARPRMSGEDLPRLYREHGPRIFDRSLGQRLTALDGWRAPKHSPEALADALREELGPGRLAEALRDVLITSYDMTDREPRFFKRWRARESEERNVPFVDAGLATAAAPTYFPSHEIAGSALVDGGVFASNPTLAAVTEALKRRTDEPAMVSPDELLVISLGTGISERGWPQSAVEDWGRVEWIKPADGEMPLIGAILDGQSDSADHWAHMLLNYSPGDDPPESQAEIGRTGPRYFRLQVRLERSVEMDDASDATLDTLEAAANRLIAERDETIGLIVERLAGLEPLPPDPYL